MELNFSPAGLITSIWPNIIKQLSLILSIISLFIILYWWWVLPSDGFVINQAQGLWFYNY